MDLPLTARESIALRVSTVDCASALETVRVQHTFSFTRLGAFAGEVPGALALALRVLSRRLRDFLISLISMRSCSQRAWPAAPACCLGTIRSLGIGAARAAMVAGELCRCSCAFADGFARQAELLNSAAATPAIDSTRSSPVTAAWRLAMTRVGRWSLKSARRSLKVPQKVPQRMRGSLNLSITSLSQIIIFLPSLYINSQHNTS